MELKYWEINWKMQISPMCCYIYRLIRTEVNVVCHKQSSKYNLTKVPLEMNVVGGVPWMPISMSHVNWKLPTRIYQPQASHLARLSAPLKLMELNINRTCKSQQLLPICLATLPRLNFIAASSVLRNNIKVFNRTNRPRALPVTPQFL